VPSKKPAEAVEEISAAFETLPLKWGVNESQLHPGGPDTAPPDFREDYHLVKKSVSHPGLRSDGHRKNLLALAAIRVLYLCDPN
jgi:hypothetical protein